MMQSDGEEMQEIGTLVWPGMGNVNIFEHKCQLIRRLDVGLRRDQVLSEGSVMKPQQPKNITKFRDELGIRIHNSC
jgi:hypothetical protein